MQLAAHQGELAPAVLPEWLPALLPDRPSQEQFDAFCAMLEGLPVGEQLHVEPMHVQAEKLLARAVVIRKDTFLAGLPHLRGCVNVCVGDITVWTVANGRQRYAGAHVLASDAGGSGRIGLAHEDTTWLTVHANLTGSDDLDAIVASLVAKPQRLIERRALR